MKPVKVEIFGAFLVIKHCVGVKKTKEQHKIIKKKSSHRCIALACARTALSTLNGERDSSWIGGPNHVKMLSLPKLICRLNVII